MSSASNLILVGPMGAGKTSIGRRLAELLRLAFVDADRDIESRTGAAVGTIFECEGEAGFRARERSVLADLLAGDGQVIATGGGAVVDEENLRLLKEKSLLICLKAPPEVLEKRAGTGRSRPLLQGEDRKDKIASLLSRREKVYAQAHLTIDTGKLSIQEIVEKILEQLPAHGGQN